MFASIRLSSLSLLLVGLTLFALTKSTWAGGLDAYEPNDSGLTASDLWAELGSPGNNCLSRGTSYATHPAQVVDSDQDWYSFRLSGEHSLEVDLEIATDARIQVRFYRGTSSSLPGSLIDSWIVEETSSEPMGHRSLELDISSGNDRTWFFKVERLGGGSKFEEPAEYHFDLIAHNPYLQFLESESGWKVPYYSNEDDLLSRKEQGQQVVRTVVVQHGINRNAHDYFDFVHQAAIADGVEDEVLIMAPAFLLAEDCPPSDERHWSGSGWKFGNLSHRDFSPRVSSYTVLDTLIEYGVSARWPNVEKVVLSGHSAGGQLAHRYASATNVGESIAPIPLAFVAANAGSYMWPDALRPLPQSVESQVPDSANLLDFYTESNDRDTLRLNADCNGDFSITATEYGGCVLSGGSDPSVDYDGNAAIGKPDEEAMDECPTKSNEYPFGVVDRDAVNYLSRDGDLTLAANFDPWIEDYSAQEVTFLLGTNDTRTYPNGVSQTCVQRVQGKNRLLRGMNYFLHFDAFYPDHNFALDLVPGIGHSGRSMLGSVQGKYRLFYEDGSLVEPPRCGLGFESVLLWPLYAWVQRRKARNRA